MPQGVRSSYAAPLAANIFAATPPVSRHSR